MQMKKSTHLWKEEDHPRDELGRFCEVGLLDGSGEIDDLVELNEYEESEEFNGNFDVINSSNYQLKFKIDGISIKAQKELSNISKRFIKLHSGTNIESCAFIDINGNKIHSERLGAYGGIPNINKIEIMPNNSIIAIHNHPNSTSFSFDDIKFLLTNKSIKCIIAAGHKGNVYILERTKNIIVEDFYKVYSNAPGENTLHKISNALKELGLFVKEN